MVNWLVCFVCLVNWSVGWLTGRTPLYRDRLTRHDTHVGSVVSLSLIFTLPTEVQTNKMVALLVGWFIGWLVDR